MDTLLGCAGSEERIGGGWWLRLQGLNIRGRDEIEAGGRNQYFCGSLPER
ncbi:hypothetical protein [Varibaculum cambriense]